MDGQQRLTVSGFRATDLCRGIAKLVKAPDFDSGIRRFESFFPCQIRSIVQAYFFDRWNAHAAVFDPHL